MRTVTEIAAAVRAGDQKAVEVLDQCLAAIDAGNDALNAFVHLDADVARAAAENVDAAVAAGRDPGSLAGVPFGVKDLEDCAGMPTSHGSLWFNDCGPVADDSVHVARLRAAGAVPVGKTAAPEFGAVAFTRTKAWGVTRNPWDPSRTPGGSSGGSAAAVAAGLVPFATASDGGGSTRIPAAFCGLVGFKASFGRIPHPGMKVAQTTSLGALTTTVADAALHLDVAAGPDDRDRTSLPPPGLSYRDAVETLDLAGLRVGWSLDLGFAAVDPEVAEIAEAAARDLFAAAGAPFRSATVSLTDPIRTWLSVNALDKWIGIEDGLWPERGDELCGYNALGYQHTENMTLRQFGRRLQYRQRLEAEVAAVFSEVDVLVTPATAVAAFAAEGPGKVVEIAGREVNPALATPFTMIGNMCWNPSVSLPAGLTAAGLPLGLQVTGRRHHDEVVLRLGRLFEQARPWARFAPGVAA